VTEKLQPTQWLLVVNSLCSTPPLIAHEIARRFALPSMSLPACWLIPIVLLVLAMQVMGRMARRLTQRQRQQGAPAGLLRRGAGQGHHTRGGGPSRGRAWQVGERVGDGVGMRLVTQTVRGWAENQRGNHSIATDEQRSNVRIPFPPRGCIGVGLSPLPELPGGSGIKV
jgi:hypothetical protein